MSRNGSIEVICGGMFSGKTEELLRRVRRELYARKCVQLFKHRLDDRYSEGHVESHIATRLLALTARTAAEISEMLEDQVEVVAIDEAQFFDDGLADFAQGLADRGVRVLLAGLDMDFQRQPFGCMPELLSIADSVTKTRAVCMTCGDEANYSYRTQGSDNVVQVGTTDAYEARCRACYEVGQRICAVPSLNLEEVV